MNFIIILIGFDIDIFTQLNTTVSHQSLLLVLLFSLPSVPLDPRILRGKRSESWALPGGKGNPRTLPAGSRALPGGRGGTMIIPIDIGPIVSVVASFTFWIGWRFYHEYLLCCCCCCCCCLKSESHLIVVVVDVVVVVIVVVVLIAIVWNEADQVVASDHHWEEAKSIESAPCMDPWLLIIIWQLCESLIITIYIPAWRVDYNYITVWLKITTVIIFCTFLSSSCIHASWVNDAADFDFPSFLW